MPRRVVVSVGGIIHISGNIFKGQYSGELYWWNYNGGNIFKGQFKGHIILVERYSRGNVQSFN